MALARCALVCLIAASLLLAGLGGGSAGATVRQAPPRRAVFTAMVSAQDDIFAAGRAHALDPGGSGGGLVPVRIAIPRGAHSLIVNATGSIDCCDTTNRPWTGAAGSPGDSTIAAAPDSGMAPYEGDMALPLIGVFLGSRAPHGKDPAAFDSSGLDGAASVRPGIAQPFYIGDGLSASGAPRVIVVPQGATRLYLGTADAVGFNGLTGYSDNAGVLQVSGTFESRSVAPTVITCAATVSVTAPAAATITPQVTIESWNRATGQIVGTSVHPRFRFAGTLVGGSIRMVWPLHVGQTATVTGSVTSDWTMQGQYSDTSHRTGTWTCAPVPSPVQAEGSAGRGIVVGFGDSVAVGYGLSAAAEPPPSQPTARYAAGASCWTTPQAYPCLLATLSGANLQESRDYAIQGATAAQVLSIEIPYARQDLPAAVRDRVSTVTLTVGADDIAFSNCLSLEMFARPDTCLRGTIRHLKVSQSMGASLATLKSNLPQVVRALRATYPKAHIFVTAYYQPMPRPVRPGQVSCRLFSLPALAAYANASAHTGRLAKVVGFSLYGRELPKWDARFQGRFYKVASFLEGRLNRTIVAGVRDAGVDSTVVSLTAFTGHSMCADNGAESWVFAVDWYGSVVGVTLPSLGPVCPYPFTGPGSAEKQKTFSLGKWGGFTISSNCVAHPTVQGQMAIARAIYALGP